MSAAVTAALPAPPLPRVTVLLPHRYPMLLVDRVEDLVRGTSIRAVKAVTLNEPWYEGLAADAPLDYPPALLIESWGQSAGLLASATAPAPDGQVMLFGSVADAQFHLPVLPGDVIEHRVRVSRSLGDSVIFEGSSHRGADTVMTVSRMVMAFRPAGLLATDEPVRPPAGRDREATA
ncbi:3-hydroxyacyl-ACP dehydratase FabZ family protein [Streptomyces anulatus]|uniref:3-hydroxyacyl-ACP dehydratase FabZ family protein n=1 Tax=Streptomyces anulatus TaxID=1892 RepID=UPI003869EF27